MTIGTTDRARQFHPFGYALVFRERKDDFSFLFNAVRQAASSVHSIDYKPTTLIADNAPSVENGFTSVFGSVSIKRVNWNY